MLKRWYNLLSDKCPALDCNDAINERVNGYKKRQCAPEYSQKCYISMLKEEQAIGNYIDAENLPSTIISKSCRKFLIQMVQSLHQVKNYKEETLYLAISIADRYLVNLVIRGEDKPVDFPSLAVSCLFLAAKIEQPFRTSLKRLVVAANQISGLTNISQKKIKNYETKVVLELEFSMHFISPLDFLERFIRIFGMD